MTDEDANSIFRAQFGLVDSKLLPEQLKFVRAIEAAATAPLLERIAELEAALLKIADWDSNWGPFPENNEDWRAMAVVTAREASRGISAAPAAIEQQEPKASLPSELDWG